MATTNISVRMDAELKKQAELMLSDMGRNMTTAMNMFLRRYIIEVSTKFKEDYKRIGFSSIESKKICLSWV